jgi:hypothetical protein
MLALGPALPSHDVEVEKRSLVHSNPFNKSQIRPRQEWMKEGQEEKRA